MSSSAEAAIAATALAAYDVASVSRLRPLADGLNTVYEVIGPQRFALRVHRPDYRTTAHTRAELLFQQFLDETVDEIAVPTPVQTRSGDVVVEVEHNGSTRVCDLLTWVDGRPPEPDEETAFVLARALASLHDASESFRPPAGVDLPRWDADGLFSVAASPYRPTMDLDEILSPEDRKLYEEIEERVRTIEAELESAFGLIHADFILGNCLLSTDGVTIFDFDDCGYGYYAYDLCPLLGNLVGYPGAVEDNPQFPELLASALAGYRSVRQLPTEWEQHLPLLMAARNAGHCLLTARSDVSPTPQQDAAWRMQLARECLTIAV